MHLQVGDEFLPTETLNGNFVGRIFSADRCALPFVEQNIPSPPLLEPAAD